MKCISLWVMLGVKKLRFVLEEAGFLGILCGVLGPILVRHVEAWTKAKRWLGKRALQHIAFLQA